MNDSRYLYGIRQNEWHSCSMPDSPPISPKPVRHGKRSRRSSRNDFSIEELSPDDIGYDGDIEVLRPDQYEESDSEFEDDAGLQRLWPDTDDELANKMQKLRPSSKCGQSPQPNESDKGRKRRSKEMESNTPNGSRQTEIEVLELVEEHNNARPAKRRMRRSTRPNVAQRLLKGRPNGWTDTSDRTEGRVNSIADLSAPSEPSGAAGQEDMEID